MLGSECGGLAQDLVCLEHEKEVRLIGNHETV
jgi:hypothetical protein